MKRTYFLIPAFILLLSSVNSNSVGQSTATAVLPFKTSGVPASYRNAMHKEMINYLSSKSSSRVLSSNRTSSVRYPLSSRESIPSSYRNTYDKIAANLGVSHLVLGKLVNLNGAYTVETMIYSRGNRSFDYQTDELFHSYNDIHETGKTLAGRVHLHLSGQIPHVYNLDVSRGKYYDRIDISWNCSESCDEYHVYRSAYQYGNYEKIDETSRREYRDKDVEPGIRYWYKVYPIKSGIRADVAERYGYRAIIPPEGADLDDILDEKDREVPPPSSAEEARKRKKHLDILEDYYMNSIKLRFIMFIGKFYVRDGTVQVFNDLYPYHLDRENLTMYVVDRDKYYIKFYCQKLFKILRETEAAGIPRDELFDRIIKNGMLFCIRTGTIRIKTDDGRTRYIPSYEALGMGTLYFKYDEDWKSHSIMMSTSNKTLSDKMEEIADR